jgi:hypothetical protein
LEIFLTYRGKIPAQRSDLSAVWEMRRSFHHQLTKIRNRDPFTLLDEPHYARAVKLVGGQSFAPLYGGHVLVQVAIDIVLLTGTPPKKSVLSSGDLDNRLKRIIDALRMPSQSGEVLSSPISPESCICLMDDDSAVSKVHVQLGTYLASDDPSESFAFIKAVGVPERVTMDNLGMLF